jgi:hypothetical protein
MEKEEQFDGPGTGFFGRFGMFLTWRSIFE